MTCAKDFSAAGLCILLIACGGRTPGNNFDPHDAGAFDSGRPDDAGPASCEPWDGDLARENRLGISRLGLALSQAVIEGTLGEQASTTYDRFVLFQAEKVWYGPQFLEGFAFWVPFDEAEILSLGLPGSAVIGFGGNAFPIESEELGGAVWWQKSVVIPSAERADYGPLVGYRSAETPLIAVVRVAQQDQERTRFEVLEAIQGEFPDAFADNWNTAIFPVPFPPPSDTEYIASLSQVTWYEAAGEYLGLIVDFRVSAPESLALVLEELGAPVELWRPTETIAFAEKYGLGWSFKVAPHVLSTSISGLADECCTGLGGTYLAEEIHEVLQGETSLAHVIAGGHGYYGPEACGDPFLLALYGLGETSGFDLSSFACDGTGVVYVDTLPWPYAPQRILALDDTPANRLQVETWLAAELPIFRLYPEDAPTAPVMHTPTDAEVAPWSVPISVERAIMASTHPSLLRIEEVVHHAEPDFYEVTFSTAFSMVWYDHLPIHRVKIAFACADPRLLEEGAEWIGMIHIENAEYFFDGEPRDAHRAFLIPGVLLPNQATVRYIVDTASYVLQTAGH